MQFQQPFDARTVEPSTFAPPPVLADYHVRITDSEAKTTTAGTGGYLELLLEILDPGPYLNRKIPYRLNIYNANQQTVEIAYRQLSAVCHVTQVFQIQDSRQFHNIPFIATIGPQANNPTYANVFAVKDLNGNMPKAASTSPVAAAPQPPAQPPAAAPWGAPPAQSTPQPPAWTPPGAPAAPPVSQPPAWTPPPAAAPPTAAPAPPWAPAAAPTAKPPWAQ